MLYNVGKTQEHGGFEQYYYYSGAGGSTIVPRVYYQSKNNWCAEIRYNYEELQTFSFNAGKKFSIKKTLSYSITPFAGIVAGKLNGGSVGANTDMDYKKLFFSSEFQYTFSIQRKIENFFFNWSELGYQLSDRIYAGLALQVTHPYETKNNWQPGVMMGFTYKGWTFPVYAFNPLGKKRNFVLGINWDGTM